MLGSPTAWDNMMAKTEVCSATANQAKAEFLVRKDSFAILFLYGFIFGVRARGIWEAMIF
jgi:hypothetical protein